MASTPCRPAEPCHSSSAVPPAADTASITSCSQFDPGNTTTPTRSANGDIRLLDHRVGEEPLAELLDTGAGRGLIVRVHGEPDGLSNPHAVHLAEAEGGEGALDGGALGIGDAGTELHLDQHRERHRV